MTPGPFALDERADLLPAVRRPIGMADGGWRMADGGWPGLRRLPVEPEVAAVVADAVRAVGQADAAKEVSLPSAAASAN